MAQAVLKFVLVGDSGVGKTSLVSYYVNRTHPTLLHVPTTLEINTHYATIDNKMVLIALYDTAGDETLNKLRSLSYDGCDIFLVVFSLSDHSSFESIITRWIPELCATNVPWFLIGTKSDIRTMTTDYIRERIRTLGASGYIETSAMWALGIDVAFEQAAETALIMKEQKKQKDQECSCCILL